MPYRDFIKGSQHQLQLASVGLFLSQFLLSTPVPARAHVVNGLGEHGRWEDGDLVLQQTRRTPRILHETQFARTESHHAIAGLPRVPFCFAQVPLEAFTIEERVSRVGRARTKTNVSSSSSSSGSQDCALFTKCRLRASTCHA